MLQQVLLGLGSPLVLSIQQISVTIAAGATSGTASISSVITANSVAVFGGQQGPASSFVATTCTASIVLTNSTTVTATRNSSDASNALVVNGSVIQFAAGVVKSNQTGSILMSGVASNTATITSVTATNTVLIYNGWTSADATTDTIVEPYMTLTNGTTITATRNFTGSSTTIYYTALEFNSGFLNSSTQQGSIALASNSTTGTATISAVTPGQAMIFWGGRSPTSSDSNFQYYPWLTLTNGTTVTATRFTGSALIDTVKFSLCEFKSSNIKSANRGSISIAGNSSSGTTSISSVNTSKCIANWLGQTCNTNTSFNAVFETIALTNSTITATRGTSGNAGTSTVGYEAIEFN